MWLLTLIIRSPAEASNLIEAALIKVWLLIGILIENDIRIYYNSTYKNSSWNNKNSNLMVWLEFSDLFIFNQKFFSYPFLLI